LHAFPKGFSSPAQSPRTLSPHVQNVSVAHPVVDDQYPPLRSSPRTAMLPFEDARRREESPVGVIGQGRASPRRVDGSAAGSTNGGPLWGGGFAGL
jgi:hypothetical protein